MGESFYRFAERGNWKEHTKKDKELGTKRKTAKLPCVVTTDINKTENIWLFYYNLSSSTNKPHNNNNNKTAIISSAPSKGRTFLRFPNESHDLFMTSAINYLGICSSWVTRNSSRSLFPPCITPAPPPLFVYQSRRHSAFFQTHFWPLPGQKSSSNLP